ncbi:ATP-binding protein [Dechloromonas sp. A34]|uniref:ATP-binding protein n=1 Tax=Dechloromonas sp. A34 TaxID=447588 RepID=UPI002248D952|nr:ATP-binding protein [Dechloromonas sp. A34]
MSEANTGVVAAGAMETFVWNDRFMTGEAIVDDEHKELVRIINWVGSLQAEQRGDPDELHAVLDKLVAYAVMHFAHEEELMASVACDERHASLHRSIHEDFARQVTAMREINLGTGDSEFLLRFLTNWLAYHILGTDQAMTRQVHNIRRGLTPAKAYEAERANKADPATANLLDALNSLYRVIASRNHALVDMNRSLEQRVAERTRDLTAANEQLVVEHHELKRAMETVKSTQMRLIESEHKRSLEAKRHMELFLAQIVDGDPVPTFVINAEHKVTHWNKACAAITGTPAALVVGTSRHWAPFYPNERPIMADLIVSSDLERLETLYTGIFRRSPVIPDAYEAEAFFPHFVDGGRWLFFTAAPLRDASGRVIGAIETLQDVTDRHKAEEGLREHQVQLEELVAQRTAQLSNVKEQLVQSEKLASIGQLAAGVAHEINNPIGFVHSNIGVLENYLGNLFGMLEAYEAAESAITDPAVVVRLKALREKIDLPFLKEDIPQLMVESKDGISRVKKIIQDLKDFSRVDCTQEWQFANLHQGIDSTVNIVANEVRYKADVVKEYGQLPDVECLVAQLNQVFMNLLVNAAHAMGEQRGTITIRTGTAGDKVWLEFSDTGSGIPEGIRQKIFDPFFTTKPVGKGTGLGLSLSYGIIQKHNGQIEVQSEVGKGTTFRITLPVRHVKAKGGQ